MIRTNAWIVMALFAVALTLFSKLLDTHPFFAAMIAGAVFWAVDLLAMRVLVVGSPRASTRLRAEDFTGPAPGPSSCLQASCTLVNIAMVLLLCIVFAMVVRSIDAWLCAFACAAFFVSRSARPARSGGRDRRI